MHLVPAIDLKNNQVVHASSGDRANYLPLATPLFPYPDPLDVINRLHKHYGYRTFYIADLGAISGIGKNNSTIIDNIINRFPDFNYWLDNGVHNYHDYEKLKKNYPCVPVLGSETIADSSLIMDLSAKKETYILSLDFKNQVFLGNKKIFQQSQYWPAIVIVLSLDAVGGHGPDFEVISKVRQYNHHSRIVSGGGIRNLNDLSHLRSVNIDMALVATALYTNQLAIPVRRKNNPTKK